MGECGREEGRADGREWEREVREPGWGGGGERGRVGGMKEGEGQGTRWMREGRRDEER